MTGEALSRALFDGALMVIPGLEPVATLVRRVRGLLQDIFEADPEHAEASLTPAAFRQACLEGRRAVAADSRIDQLWQQTLAAVGYPPQTTWRDRIRLRVVPSQRGPSTRVLRALPAHRDTWGSGIMAQVNWWLPLYPLSPDRTMVVWPEAFRRAVDNDSAAWNYQALVSGRRDDYPLLPVARKTPGKAGQPVLIEPGELLAFSAAHLHAGRTDDSGRSRFSLDTRTVWNGDLRAGRGAVNVDGAIGREHWEWFRRPADTPANNEEVLT